MSIRGENISGFMLHAITIQHKEKKSIDPLRGNYDQKYRHPPKQTNLFQLFEINNFAFVPGRKRPFK